MQTIRERLIFLDHTMLLTRKRLRKIIQKDPSLENIFLYTSQKLTTEFAFTTEQVRKIQQAINNPTIKAQYEKNLQNYHVITYFDKNYPVFLKHIKDPPLVLYALGDISLLHAPSIISVIGTRNPSNEAMTKIRNILPPLLKYNWTIVSGMAYGVDSLAHQVTLYYGGKTIAVLGGGFEHIYPKENIPLFKSIMNEGLVISEYPPHIRPKRHYFPERNRIISGISQAVLVIEAMERSGTLITVDQALDQGREVYAIPGSIQIPQTKGCHQMIQDGAKLVISASDILEDW